MPKRRGIYEPDYHIKRGQKRGGVKLNNVLGLPGVRRLGEDWGLGGSEWLGGL